MLFSDVQESKNNKVIFAENDEYFLSLNVDRTKTGNKLEPSS